MRLKLKYRKKAIEVEAWQIDSGEPMPEWAKSYIIALTFKPHSWLVKEPDGLVGYLWDENFREQYDAVE
jgi:hypothetical protein